MSAKVSIRITDETSDHINVIGKARGIAVTEIARRAISFYHLIVLAYREGSELIIVHRDGTQDKVEFL